ncbi:MAG: MlaD family protein [Gemmatimonadales bacterium]|nr:MCE family protein [Gemmatimonadota bacterium]MDX2057863.1 MlaD family protein [Gemmatimonadales bacterium]
MKRRNEFLVGISVLIAFAVVVGGAIWLSETDLGNPDVVHTARFREIGGLGVGAPVTLRGVKVGRVNAIRLADNDWVETDLKVRVDVVLPAKPVAIAASGSLFGEWQVTVVDLEGAPQDPELRARLAEAGAPGGDTWPGATLPDIGQLTQQASRIAGDIGLITNRVSGALDSSAIQDVRRSLHDLREAADRLAEFARRQTGPFNEVTSNLAVTSGEVGAASKRVNALLGRVDSATADGQIVDIMNSTRATAADLRSASSDAKELLALVRQHERTLTRILETTDTLLTKVQSGKGSLGLLARDSTLYLETTAVIAQMRQLLADIQANPRRYFRFSVF